MRLLAAFALALALALPLAAAQALPVQPVKGHVAVSAEDPGRALQPGEVEPIALLVSYASDPGGRPAPNVDPNSPNLTAPTQVTFEVKTKPSWALDIVFSPPVVNFSLETPGQNPSPTHALALVNVSRDAPAIAREELVVIAKAAPNGNIAPDQAESAPITLRAAIVTKINVTPPPGPFVVPGGRGVHIPFTIKNLGNSNVTARLNVTSRPQDSLSEVATTVELPRNGTATVDVILRLPWTYGEVGTVALEATPITENDDGKAVTAEVDVAGQSAVPGAPLALLVAALVAVALLRRR